jgi:hypothetical protein
MEIVDFLNYAKNNKTMKNYKPIFQKEINPIVIEDYTSHIETNTNIVEVRNYLHSSILNQKFRIIFKIKSQKPELSTLINKKFIKNNKNNQPFSVEVLKNI